MNVCLKAVKESHRSNFDFILHYLIIVCAVFGNNLFLFYNSRKQINHFRRNVNN